MCTSNSHHSKRRKSSWLCALCCCVLCATHLTAATENISHSIQSFGKDFTALSSSHNKRVLRSSVHSHSDTENEQLNHFIANLSSIGVNLTERLHDHVECYQANQIIQRLQPTVGENLTNMFDLLQKYEKDLDWKVCPKHFHEPPVLGGQTTPTTPVSKFQDWRMWLYTFLSVTLISLVGLVAVALIPLMHQAFYHILIQFLISLAVGSLVGDALLHLIPHALFPHGNSSDDAPGHDHDHDHDHRSDNSTSRISHKDAIYMSIMGLGGVLIFFVAERIVIVYQMWKAKSKYTPESYQAEDAGYMDSSASVSSKHSSTGIKERSSDYRTALNSHNSELEEIHIINDRGRTHNVPWSGDPGIVPLVQVISSSKPLLTGSLPKICDSGLSAAVRPNNGDLSNGGADLSPHFHTSSSAQMSPSKKHRLGWGCVQHSGALSALEPIPQHVSHSADVLFCGNCNQPPVLQTRTDCNDPMDEESCLKGRPRKLLSNSKDLRSSMPFLALRTSDQDMDHHSHKHLASDEAPMLHDTNHHAFVRSPEGHHHHHHSHENEGAGHCHGLGLQQRNPRPHSHHHGHSHDLSSVRSIAYTILAGDGLHNFCDGIAIGAAFAAHSSDGLAVSLAVLCHELPHELGDFAVLLHAGIPVRSAVYYNVFSSILCYIGAIIGVLTGSNSSTLGYVFMFTAGMFLYIALVDMVPELTTQRLRGNQLFTNPICLLFIHTLGIVLGGTMMLGISLMEKH